jgi:cysteinyl-tRNA synthetase
VSDLPEPERYSPFGDSAALGGGLTAAEPFVKCLASFRDEVRALAAAGGSAAELLALCDRVRDRELRGLGVRLEDRTGEAARWALASPAELKAEAEAARVAAEKRSAARAAAQAKEAAVAAMRAVPAARMFAPEMDSLFGRTEPFSAWDAEGLPTHGADGEPLSKSARKKAEKAHAKQKENQAGR